MCGRFTLFDSDAILSKAFGVPISFDLASRYNVAPSQPILSVRVSPETGKREFAWLRWGFIPHWAKDPYTGNRMINARAETVAEKPVYRYAFKRRRCLIPASGFYEWKKEERRKQPYYIRMQDGQPFTFAGLWEHWEGSDGSTIETCAILTTESNAVLSPLHNRMPVIIGPKNYVRWLDPTSHDPASLKPLLVPYAPAEMVAYPVSLRVNNPANDDKSCIAPSS